jgi:hypothetical protein
VQWWGLAGARGRGRGTRRRRLQVAYTPSKKGVPAGRVAGHREQEEGEVRESSGPGLFFVGEGGLLNGRIVPCVAQ